MPEDTQDDLLKILRKRRAFDDRWQLFNFVAYQIVLGVSIIASFASSIIAASDMASPMTVAVLAAIPGTVIVLDRGFMFCRRWRWHNRTATELDALERQLTIEGVPPEKVSAAMSRLMREMEQIYPAKGEIEEHLGGDGDAK